MRLGKLGLVKSATAQRDERHTFVASFSASAGSRRMLRIAATRALRHGALVRPVVASRAFSVTETRRQASVSDAYA